MSTSTNKVPLAPPPIASLSPIIVRPLWSVMIPTYNCTTYLKEALLSVLAQNWSDDRMQIEVVDDASTEGDVAALVASIGGERVRYFRQPSNVGSLRNFEACLNRAQGHLVHLLHCDDRISPGFYEKMSLFFDRHPEAGAAFCHHAFIDENGDRIWEPPLEATKSTILPNWLLRSAEHNRIQYVTIAVRRSVYEKLGGFYGTTYGEDWEMWVRIAAHYPIGYIPELLAEYRVHADSISGVQTNRGQVLPTLFQVMKRIQQHLPLADRQRVLSKSRQYYARYGIYLAHQVLAKSQDWALAKTYMEQSVTLGRDPSLYRQLFRFYKAFALSKWKRFSSSF